jgi:hypothetical protein
MLFSFNWFGYRIVFDYMEHKANTQLEYCLDNNSYDESELIVLKIPVHLPYQNDWPAYQRFNGEIKMNGILYKYVKRKLANDTLYLKCIQDTKKMDLQKAKNDFFSISNNLAQDSNSKKSHNTKAVVKDLQLVYCESSFFIKIASPSAIMENCWLPANTLNLHDAFLFTPEQPPDHTA